MQKCIFFLNSVFQRVVHYFSTAFKLIPGNDIEQGLPTAQTKYFANIIQSLTIT